MGFPVVQTHSLSLCTVSPIPPPCHTQSYNQAAASSSSSNVFVGVAVCHCCQCSFVVVVAWHCERCGCEKDTQKDTLSFVCLYAKTRLFSEKETRDDQPSSSFILLLFFLLHFLLPVVPLLFLTKVAGYGKKKSGRSKLYYE